MKITGIITFLRIFISGFPIRTILALCAILWSRHEVFSQAPDSLAGITVQLSISSGTYPLATAGSYRFLPSATDNAYAIVPISGAIAPSFGTYNYAKVSSAAGLLNLTDPAAGALSVGCNFTSINSGNFVVRSALSVSPLQTGSFVLFSGSSPATIIGHKFTVNITSGSPPFGTSGSYEFIPITDSTYQIAALSGNIANSSGSYNYTQNSVSTGLIRFDDSIAGPGSASELSFDTATSGTIFLRQAGGVGYQTGTFIVSSIEVVPSISTQPQSLTVTAGSSATFSVTATGTSLSYQWRRNGIAMPGATSATLTVSNAQTTNAGSYTVVVSNSAGSATTNPAVLTVNPLAVAPTISTQSISQTVTVGANAAFSVTVNGTTPLNYQWQKNGVPIAGASNATLTISNVQNTNAGSYVVVVSNSAGSATAIPATLIVNPAPVAPAILTQPTNQAVIVGATVTFSVTASGTARLHYQWEKNGVFLSGAAGPTLTITNVQSTDSGAYAVVVTNSVGSATSAPALLTVSLPALPPSIVTQPQSQAVNRGSTATLTVRAEGTPPLSYQWRFSGTNILSATNAVLTLTNVTLAQAGDYTVAVTNSAGSAVSMQAELLFNWILTATANRGGGVSATQPSYAPNSSTALTAIPQTGFLFKSWSGDASGTNNPLTIVMDRDKAVVANFVVPSPRMKIEQLSLGTVVQISFPATIGERYRIDVSTDAVNWTPLNILQAITSELQSQAFIGKKQGFYRAVWEP